MAASSISSLVAGNAKFSKVSNSETLKGRISSKLVSMGSTWNISLAWTDLAAVNRIYSNPNTQYEDLKKILVSAGTAGSSITLHIDLHSSSSLWLCQLPGSPPYPETMGNLHQDAFIKIQFHVGKLILTDPFFSNSKTGIDVELDQIPGSDCFKTQEFPKGTHALTISQASDEKQVLNIYIYATIYFYFYFFFFFLLFLLNRRP